MESSQHKQLNGFARGYATSNGQLVLCWKGQEQASKSEGSSGRFVGLGVILCLGCFVGCFVFQEYDGRIPKVFAFFKSRMKGYTSFIVS